MKRNLFATLLTIGSVFTLAVGLSACKNAPGNTVENGKSAYDLYKEWYVSENGSEEGMLGESAWLESLHGQTGVGVARVEVVCGDIVVYYDNDTSETLENALPEAGHRWDEGVISTEPTCTAPGAITYTCEDCGATKTLENAIPETGHSWDEGVTSTEPTCITPGVVTYTCGECGATKKELADANGAHRFGDYEYDNDAHWRTCKICGETEKHAHEFGDVSKDSDVDARVECVCGISKTVGEFYSYKVNFQCGEGVSVVVYETQDYSGEGNSSNVAYARDSSSGELLNNGNGQVNFEIILDFGYSLKEIKVTPSSNYKNLKGAEDTGSNRIYRITKITGELTVRVETEQRTLDSSAIEFSAQSGFYDEEFDLSIQTPSDCTVYYTLDGSDPTNESIPYTGALKIKDRSSEPNVLSAYTDISTVGGQFFPTAPVDKCTVIKAIAVDSAGACSPIVTGIYFVGYQNKSGYDNIKIMSLSLDPADLFDDETGIYTTGAVYENNGNGEHEYYTPANYTQKGREWERKATMTVFDNGVFSFEQDIGIRIHGGWSRAFNQKSFNLYARTEYSGSNSFDQPFFGGTALKTCMLRNGGFRDTFLTKMRDVLNQNLSAGMSFQVQGSVPCILFLNGEYWGVYNLQERFSDHYVEEHYGIDKNDVVIIQDGAIDVGTQSDLLEYQKMVEFFANTDLSVGENYTRACELIDIQSFIEYMSVELYVANADWLANNVRIWRSRTVGDKPYQDGKWRFMMYDTDDCANVKGIEWLCGAHVDSFVTGHWTSQPLETDNTLGILFTSLLQNSEFRSRFSTAFTDIANTRFSYEHVHEVLYELAELYAEPMVNFYGRFVSESESYDAEYFYEQVKIIDDFFKARGAYILAYMEQHVNAFAE